MSIYLDALGVNHPADNTSNMSAFFASLFGSYFEHLDEPLSDYRRHVRGPYIPLIGQDSRVGDWRPEYFSNIDCLLERIAELERKNVYFGLAPRRSKQMLRRAVDRAVVCHVDIDGASAVELRRLREEQPTAIIESSPHRYHAYRALDTPAGPGRFQLAEEVNRAIAQQFKNGDVGAWDVSRVLRVPGTKNYTWNKNGEPVELLELNRRKHSLFGLADRFLGPLSPASERMWDTYNNIGAPPPLRGSERERAERLLESGLTEPSSRETSVLLLIRYFAGKGCSRDETARRVVQFLREKSNGMSKDWADRPQWVEKNVIDKVNNWWSRLHHGRRRMAELDADDLVFIASLNLPRREGEFIEDAMLFI